MRRITNPVVTDRRRVRRLAPSRAWPALILGVVIGLGLWPPLPAASFDITDTPPRSGHARPRFQVDSGSLLGPDGPEVALAFRIPYSELYFEKKGEYFVARFDLIILLTDGKRQVGGDLWPVKVRTLDEAESRSKETFYKKIIRLPVTEGKRSVEVSIQENASGRASKVSWKLEIPKYESEELSLSSLWVTECSGDSSEAAEESLPPLGWIFSHRYGEPLPDLCVLGQVYREQVEGPLELTWRIIDPHGGKVQEERLHLSDAPSSPFVIHPDFSALWLGSYVFELEASTGGAKARRRFHFEMDETMVSLVNNLEQSLDLIRLIASDAEVRVLEDVTPEERQASWDRFWEERDPTPGTEENEFKIDFFERVRLANERFGVLEPGWKSDRGRIFIRFGSPEEIETRPSTMNGLSVEIWTYIQLGRRFVFVDYDGFGRYELYQPGRS